MRKLGICDKNRYLTSLLNKLTVGCSNMKILKIYIYYYYCLLFLLRNVTTWSLNHGADLPVWFSRGGLLSVCVTFSIERELEGGTLHLNHT